MSVPLPLHIKKKLFAATDPLHLRYKVFTKPATVEKLTLPVIGPLSGKQKKYLRVLSDIGIGIGRSLVVRKPLQKVLLSALLACEVAQRSVASMQRMQVKKTEDKEKQDTGKGNVATKTCPLNTSA